MKHSRTPDWHPRLWQLSAATALLTLAGCTDESTPAECGLPQSPDADLSAVLCAWEDSAQNPLIEPPDVDDMIADPTVATPEETPDGKWHLFAHNFSGIHHYTSPDGLDWTRLPSMLFTFGAFRPYLLRDGDTWYLFFEQFSTISDSQIEVATSTDLIHFSEPEVVLSPELPWEKEVSSTVGNPYVTKRDGQYWLYYSAASVYLPDAEYNEPRYIGVATADAITGPYTKGPSPILSPDPDDPIRNMGAGSLKLLDDPAGGHIIALENGIYKDAEGKSRSAIMVLRSDDGRSFTKVCPGTGAVLSPSATGWKSSFVYAFDTARSGDTLRVYYNAREGWAVGTERIGMASLPLPCDPR